MIEEQKKTQEGFQSYCGGMPCGDMMRKMMEAKKSDLPFNCEEMMSKMMQMFRGAGEKKERSPREPEESSAPKQ
jgi:hypothetical protein